MDAAHGSGGQTLPGICCWSGALPSCHSGARCSWSWRGGGKPAGSQPAQKPSHCGLGCHDPEGPLSKAPHRSPSGSTSKKTQSICEPPPEFFYGAIGTAAPVFSSAVNLSSTPHCLHMATRSLCPGSLSYTAGDRYLHDSCVNWKQPLWACLLHQSNTRHRPHLPHHPKDTNLCSPLSKWALC